MSFRITFNNDSDDEDRTKGVEGIKRLLNAQRISQIKRQDQPTITFSNDSDDEDRTKGVEGIKRLLNAQRISQIKRQDQPTITFSNDSDDEDRTKGVEGIKRLLNAQRISQIKRQDQPTITFSNDSDDEDRTKGVEGIKRLLNAQRICQIKRQDQPTITFSNDSDDEDRTKGVEGIKRLLNAQRNSQIKRQDQPTITFSNDSDDEDRTKGVEGIKQLLNAQRISQIKRQDQPTITFSNDSDDEDRTKGVEGIKQLLNAQRICQNKRQDEPTVVPKRNIRLVHGCESATTIDGLKDNLSKLLISPRNTIRKPSHFEKFEFCSGKTITVGVPQICDCATMTDAILTAVPSTDQVFQDITSEVNSTIQHHVSGMTYSRYNIVSIERVENCCLWKKYNNRRMDIQKEGFSLNQKLLYHGTQNAMDIVNGGFDEKYSNIKGMFGAGVYFAEDSSKSNQYVFGYIPGGNGCPSHGNANCTSCHRCMLLCVVTLGIQHKLTQSKKMAHPPPGFHSVVGMPSSSGLRYPEYIVYRGEQAYPAFLIKYTIVV